MITFATWLTLHQSVPYVVAAYLVFLAVIVIYVAIMARRVSRGQQDLADLRAQLTLREQDTATDRETESVG